MSTAPITCPQCGEVAQKEVGAIGRAKRAGAPIYCSRVCGGLARRKHKSDNQKKAEKSAYDAQRRIELRDRIRAQKAAYHKRTYDPVRAAEHRAMRMAYHVEYCRRPEYRAWKREYDKKFRAKKEFGPFWESAILLGEIETEVLSRASRYEIDLQNGKLNKATKRKREYGYQTFGG